MTFFGFEFPFFCLFVEMVNFDEIAVFILSTSRAFQHFSSINTRILPIRNTWGSLFVHLYFIFGTNVFDFQYLANHCAKVEEYSSVTGGGIHRRRLGMYTPQVAMTQTLSLYQCPLVDQPDSIQDSAFANHGNVAGSHFNVLFTGNCTGEYFGIGPTCRCEQSLKYFLSNSDFKRVKWFVFMDDDIYVRPHSLLSLLSSIESNASFINKDDASRSTGPLGIVSSEVYRSFSFSKRWDPDVVNCATQDIHEFPVAQPAILSR